MSTPSLLSSLLASALATALLCACSSSTTSATGDAGAPDTGTSTAALSCADYCATLTANCTAANAQFGGLDRCLSSCKSYPVGAAADTSGNTLGCRTYHAGAAKADPVTHCVHAGPAGAGVCGANCDGYCQIAMMYCTAANKVYASLDECKTVCAGFPATAKYSANDMAIHEKKDVACLVYHVQEASTVPDDHCLGDLAKGDAGAPSVTCTAP